MIRAGDPEDKRWGGIEKEEDAPETETLVNEVEIEVAPVKSDEPEIVEPEVDDVEQVVEIAKESLQEIKDTEDSETYQTSKPVEESGDENDTEDTLPGPAVTHDTPEDTDSV